ncbi:hypothetical protein AJ80_03949 [Polytolypa hystricis UAMH7299]|uniref:Uncharacterized protein n=1 Tax=Polytolypa hystricis (strain UAMH7299) TaxID=1447883 RepID=A0A2B7YEX1_POLH7|nr:hypothetical protein AJ80_03949 [Polytolypa hystricis UAMH7299]
MDEPPAMDPYGEAYLAARETIGSSRLPAIEHLALILFLLASDVPERAGQYLLQRVSQNLEIPLEDILRSLRKDIQTLAFITIRDDNVSPDIDAALREREGHRCCVTGWTDNVKATYVIAPSIVYDKDLQSEGRLRPLLNAILSEDRAEQLFSTLKLRGKEHELKNLWLMAPSVRNAYCGGHIKFAKSPYLEEEGLSVRSLGENGGERVI